MTVSTACSLASEMAAHRREARPSNVATRTNVRTFEAAAARQTLMEASRSTVQTVPSAREKELDETGGERVESGWGSSERR
jgi:hypothetical protein